MTNLVCIDGKSLTVGVVVSEYWLRYVHRGNVDDEEVVVMGGSGG